MSVEELARLSNIALAEIGVPPVFRADPSATHPMRLAVKWGIAPVAVTKKASRLARLRLFGPSFVTSCDAHPIAPDIVETCAGVPVADALRGRLCENAGRS